MPESAKAVYAAIAGNVAVTVTKFIAAAATGSSAMLTEAFHSVADTANDCLLVWGRKRSRRPPDRQHPFGHGQEFYFWSFLVAIVVFAVGGGFSTYQGIMRIRRPGELENPLWNYVVLALAAVFEGTSLVIGYKQLRKHARGRSLWRFVRSSKDPSVFTVVLEDTAALIGIGMAFLGIWLAHALRMPMLEGFASLAIGILLTLVSLLLARESKGLLLGEAISAADLAHLRQTIQSCPGVERADSPLTMYFGPDEVLAAVNVEFNPRLSSQQVAESIDQIENAIRNHYPKIKRIFIEADAIRSVVRRPE